MCAADSMFFAIMFQQVGGAQRCPIFFVLSEHPTRPPRLSKGRAPCNPLFFIFGLLGVLLSLNLLNYL